MRKERVWFGRRSCPTSRRCGMLRVLRSTASWRSSSRPTGSLWTYTTSYLQVLCVHVGGPGNWQLRRPVHARMSQTHRIRDGTVHVSRSAAKKSRWRRKFSDETRHSTSYSFEDVVLEIIKWLNKMQFAQKQSWFCDYDSCISVCCRHSFVLMTWWSLFARNPY